MQAYLRINFLIAVLLLGNTAVLGLDSHEEPFVRPIVGSRMVIGNGEVADYTLACFVELCRAPLPNVVILDLAGDARIDPDSLVKHGAASVVVLDSVDMNAEELAVQLLDKHGVWIAGESAMILDNKLLLALLKNVTHRNGVVAMDSSAIEVISELDDNAPSRRLESPFVHCEFYFDEHSWLADSASSDSQWKVRWLVPDSSVLVVHRGRQVAGYGYADVSVLVKEAAGWPERSFVQSASAGR